MQVSISFAESHVASHPYPFTVSVSIRREVFTRKLTTEWFAKHVDERYRRCLAKASAASNG